MSKKKSLKGTAMPTDRNGPLKLSFRLVFSGANIAVTWRDVLKVLAWGIALAGMLWHLLT